MQRPTRLSDADLATIGHLLPAVEPALSPCPSGPRKGRTYPVAETHLIGNEKGYLDECVSSNWISSKGPFIDRFETAFAREAGTRHAVSCSSGTTALHLVMSALGLGAGDEVIVPAFTMIACPNAVRYTGATVKLVDAESDHLGMDPASIEAAITPATRAILVVHVYGHPARMDAIHAVARRHGLLVVEDAAEAHGAEYAGKRAGSLGTAGTFSFYANKIITTGEGGMVTTDDAELARLVRTLRDHAFSPERHFWHQYTGFNYRMTNLQAAVGLAQVERLGAIVDARRRLAGWYRERLAHVPGLVVPGEAADSRSVFWMYGIQVEAAFGLTRDALRQRLAGRGVETRSFFIPVHLQPIYFDQFRGQAFPVAERLCRQGLYLPTSEALTEADCDWICRQIADPGAA